jgi:hypothetical protein
VELNRDFRDLFAALNAAAAEYLLVGGYAVAVHAEPRYTKDLDVWVGASTDNGARVFAALREFGAPLEGVTATDFATADVIFQMGMPPNRIDVITSVQGLEFGDCWTRRLEIAFGDQVIHVIGRADLIHNKRAVARPQDLADAALLEKHASR